MFKHLKRIVFVAMLLAIIPTAFVQAQQNFEMADNQELKVEGTSTIHDWHMTSTKATGKAVINITEKMITEISSLEVILPATSLESGKGGMDKNAFKALDTKKHENISFKLESINETEADSLTATGSLTISGVTQPVTMRVAYKIEDAGIRFIGSHPIKFTDFNIDPPKAVFGTIKTGDELTLSFNTLFQPNN